MRCPKCGETDPRIVEATKDGRWLCSGCDTVWTHDDIPRLPLDPPPTSEQRRKDLDLA